MEGSLLKHLVALFVMNYKGYFDKIMARENWDKMALEELKADIWNSYTYADFYIKTVEEQHNPDPAKRKWGIPSSEMRYTEKK